MEETMEKQAKKQTNVQMEEKDYKVYDSMYNVVGVASYEEVHTKGLLHQVVHFWLVEKKEGELWLYLQKREDDDPVYKGVYDILTSGHIDPEETHEEAILHQIKDQLGLNLRKDQLIHIGHINQRIERGRYHDNAFVQTYFYEMAQPEKAFSSAKKVVKAKLGELKDFAGNPDKKVMVYTVTGEPLQETTHEQWWRREEEFKKVVAPYIETHLL